MLYKKNPSGRYRVADSDDILAAASAIKRRDIEGIAFTSPNHTREFLLDVLSKRDHEIFCALFLDNRNRLIEFRELFHGTIDGTSVHPREVVKRALAVNAAAVIFAHNHPSGVCEPSKADEWITSRLKNAFGLLDIRVLDHIIVGDSGTVSFAERGLL